MSFIVDAGGGFFDAGDPPRGVCVAFMDDTFGADPTWTRLDDPSGYRLATGWTISRGRQTALDKTGTGTAQVTFKDLNGVLDPTNVDSPFHYPSQLVPTRQAGIALMNPMTGDWSSLFTGYVTGYNHELEMFTPSRGIDTVTMDLVDGFDLLASMTMTPTQHGYTPTKWADFADVYYRGNPSNFTGEPPASVHVDDRIMKILDDAGWPNAGGLTPKRSGLRNIFSGNVLVQGNTYSRHDTILQALFDAADAEFPGIANIYMSKYGVVTFHGRYARFHPERPGYGIGSWTCGDLSEAEMDSDCAPIAGLSYHMSKDDIINACIVLPAGYTDVEAPENLVKDPTSIGKYGWRSLSIDNLLVYRGHNDAGDLVNALDETRKYAEYYVQNFAYPQTRVSRIRFRPRGHEQIGAAALWDLMCNVEIGDRITLKTNHAGGGGFISDDFFVEGIHYDAQPGRVDMHDITMELDVSPGSFFANNPFGDFDDS